MKKTITDLIFSCALLAGLSSCNFLTVPQIGKSDIEGYFSEPSAVNAAVVGLHHLTYKLVDSYLFLYSDVAGDCMVLNTSESTWDMYQNFSTTSDDEVGALGYIWKNAYQVINNANQIISHVPGLIEKYPTDKDELNNYLAQALFIRAYAHLGLVLAYGQNYSYTADASHLGVPVITRALGLNELPSRDKVGSVYDRIIEDLKSAIEHMAAESVISNKFYPSRLAAQALLARVYLYKGDWKEAAARATEVIDAVPLTPRADYVAMFNAMEAPKADEIIYSLNGFQLGSSLHKMYWKKEPKARPSTKVIDLYEEGDIRLKVTTSQDEAVCLKYEQKDGETDAYSNVPVLRVSEMYLIRAEASLMRHDTKQASEDIAALRTRAMGKDVVLPQMSEEELDLEIEQERIRELCFEGQRLWDITRRHKNLERPSDTTSQLKELTYPDYRFVLQIPSTELDANTNMINNPTANETAQNE